MSDTNPYQAPTANLATEAAAAAGTFRLINPRSVSIGHGWSWIADGFGHFKRNPGAWILLLIVGLLIFIAASFVPIVGQIAVMGTTYVWFAGIILGCRAQDNGEDFKLEHLFAGFSSKPGQLILLSIFTAVVGVIVVIITMGPVFMDLIAMSSKGGQPDPEAMQQLTNQFPNPGDFFKTWLLTMLCTIPLYMAVWFAPALIVLNDVPLLRALKLSFIGCLKNILPFLLYFIIGMTLYMLSALPLLLGLLVFLPTMLASLYTSYTDIFIDRSEA